MIKKNTIKLKGGKRLINAVKAGNTKEVSRLLSLTGTTLKAWRKVNILKDGFSALKLAVIKGHTDIVNLLLKLDLARGINPGNQDNEALKLALYETHKEIVKLLLKDSRVDAVADNNMAIRMAAYKGWIDIVELLLENPNVNPGAKDNAALKLALKEKHKETVKLLLKDSRVDATTQDNVAVKMAVQEGWIDIVELLLKDRRVNAATNNNFPIRKAVYKGWIDIVELLLQNPNVNPGANNNEALVNAVTNNNKEIVALLLSHKKVDPEAQNNKCLEIAMDKKYDEIVQLLLETPKKAKPMWQGWRKGDAEDYDIIFNQDPNALSICPICLKPAERQSGCMYTLEHNCALAEGYYHKGLYKKYLHNGKIEFCFICGRICQGHHHYHLDRADSANPPLFPSHDPFAKDCKNEGGGGFKEKVMRYRRIREQALDLQSKIGKISFTEAMDSLVEAGWNAPLAKENPAIDTIMRTKKWDISSDKFPIFNPKIEEEKKDYSKYPNIVNPKTKGLEPSLIVGEDPITLDETEVIQFHHKQPNGEIYNHEESYISPDSLEKFIIIQIDENSQDFGNCWDREHCKGILYPQEIKGFVSDKTYNEYRQLFNWRFRFVREGGRRKTRKMCISARK